MAICLRRAQASDCDQILDIYQYYVLNTLATTEVDPVDKETFLGHILQISHDYPYVVIERDGKVVAYSYASRQRERPGYNWNVELSIYVAPGNVGQKLGRILYQSVMDLLLAQHIQNVYAIVVEGNEASHLLHQNFGFTAMGFFEKCAYKQGSWLDITHYHKRLMPLQKPTPFVPMHELDEEIIAGVCNMATSQLESTKEEA